MRSLSIPIPVAIFFRRLFNVFSSITISNQYLLTQKADGDVRRDEAMKENPLRKTEGCISVKAETDSANPHQEHEHKNRVSTSYTHWERLKPWPWSASSGRPTSRKLQSATVNEVKKRKPLKDVARLDDNPLPRGDSSSSNSKPEDSRNLDKPLSPIYTLMNNPTLFDPVRVPRNPIVLCHGLYGYDVRGPSSFPMFQLHYWANVLKVLKKRIGAEVIVTGVPGTGSIESRARRLDQYLSEKASFRDINLVAHSMGGLDCRHLITNVKPRIYYPVSLTTISTPHRGSPFMDWCKEYLGLGRIGKLQQRAQVASQKASETVNSSSTFSLANLPSSLTTFLLSVLDSPAYANLTTHYLADIFNPATPDDPYVRYYSVAARTDSVSVLHPLWLPKTVLDGVEARERAAHPHPEEVDWGNDGLVTVRSAKWGEFLGTLEGCDHWDVRGGGGLGPDAEWNVDLALPSSIKDRFSDPLSFVNTNLRWKDLARYVAIWRKEEKKREVELSSQSSKSEPSGYRGSSARDLKDSSVGSSQRTTSSDAEDAALKSSTDRLSAVFDWVSDQVASSSKPMTASDVVPLSDLQIHSAGSPDIISSTVQETEKRRVDKKEKESGDSRLKFDLERFYVALCRKLYDDGL